jgi:hypothetical protein
MANAVALHNSRSCDLQIRKTFFFEKKNQKTFTSLGRVLGIYPRQRGKGFLLLFSKKKADLLSTRKLLFTPAMPANPHGSSPPCARFGRLLALVLFFAAQISSSTIARTISPPGSPLAALQAAMVLCVGANHSAPDHPAPVHHHVPDTALAAYNSIAFQPAALLHSDGTVLPASRGLSAWTILPPACRPPARFAGIAYPTGPPDRLI